MDRETLLYFVNTLPGETPLVRPLEMALNIGVGFGGAWYGSQKEHWLRWLTEYETVGAYGRKPKHGRSARGIYNRLCCAPMAFWLAEAVGVSDNRLRGAYAAAIAAPANGPSQCAAVRSFATWEAIELKLA